MTDIILPAKRKQEKTLRVSNHRFLQATTKAKRNCRAKILYSWYWKTPRSSCCSKNTVIPFLNLIMRNWGTNFQILLGLLAPLVLGLSLVFQLDFNFSSWSLKPGLAWSMTLKAEIIALRPKTLVSEDVIQNWIRCLEALKCKQHRNTSAIRLSHMNTENDNPKVCRTTCASKHDVELEAWWTEFC